LQTAEAGGVGSHLFVARKENCYRRSRL